MRGFTGWTGVVLDAADPRALAEFYAALTGWDVQHKGEGWSTLHQPGTAFYLGFHANPVHEAPVWPSEAGRPQQQLHLDLGVSDVAAAVADALGAGAALHPHQPQEGVRVLVDPAGHTFCLYQDEEAAP